MADLAYQSLKGIALATIHSSAINLGIAYMDNLLEGEIISGTHLTSMAIIQSVGAATLLGFLMDFNGASLTEEHTSFIYELVLAYGMRAVLGSKIETIMSFILNEAIEFLVPQDVTEEQAAVLSKKEE